MRQNPHVRICGGPGSATTLVYPTRTLWRYSHRTLIFLLTTRPVTFRREVRYIRCVFLALMRKPVRSMTLL